MIFFVAVILMGLMIHQETCVFGNHNFQKSGDRFVCKKCGLIKKTVRK